MNNTEQGRRASMLDSAARTAPPHVWFLVSAVFHYLGPSFAVLLFPATGVLGVAWFRIATAAAVFAPLTRPWRTIARADRASRLLLVGLGICMAVMNTSFYLALERLPMSLVAAMEFLGTIAIALWGLRSTRNVTALGLAIVGVYLLVDVAWATDPLGLMWAGLNAALFALYVVLGHKAAEQGAGRGTELLGAAMAIAFVAIAPIGFVQAAQVFGAPTLVLAGVAVGVCSSVVPYVCDQLAMARLPRATFALLLSLLPAMATAIAALVLAQIPDLRDLIGVALVMAGVAVHRPRPS